jgi:PAS domain S-box-containing protein
MSEKTLALSLLEKFSEDREKMERYSAVAEFCPIPAFIVAHDGLSVVYVNRAYREFTGTSLHELQDFGWTKIIDESDRQRAEQEWRQLMQTDQPVVSHRHYLAASGDKVKATLVAQRVENNGYVGFIIPECNDKLVSPAGLSPAT